MAVSNPQTVYQELTRPSAKDKRSFGINSHYRFFSFTKRSTNVIVGIFKSNALTQTKYYTSHIVGLHKLLKQKFGSNVKSINTIDLHYQFEIQQTNSNTLTKVKFYFAEPKKSVVNEGQLYEIQTIERLRRANYTTQTTPEGIDGRDVTVNVNGITAGIELKEKIKAAFGSATLEFTGMHWQLKSSTKQNPSIPSIVSENKILNIIQQRWYTDKGKYYPGTRASKYDQQILGEIQIPISASHIREYYKYCDYIHIKGKGFYLINRNKDPLGLNPTFFDPTDSYVRVRVQSKGSDTFRYALELYIGSVRTSNIREGLDGDLSFLEG